MRHNVCVDQIPRTFTAEDAWAFNGGSHATAYEVLGAHYHPEATAFRVWAPNATAVAVIGDFNDWGHRGGPLFLDPDPSGVWRGTVQAAIGDRYKYAISTGFGTVLEKADPYGFAQEEAPRTGSVITSLDYEWRDEEWMADRGWRFDFDAPVSIYEVHLGSWRYEPGGYVEQAKQLADYLVDMGFTHVELMPTTEHPYYGSWGYQTTGYFAPTSRYGSPAMFMELVDILHRAGIGVILDWVPSHFPDDTHGLALFDGTHLYEYEDPRLGRHPDWGSLIFNYGRPEVRSFLMSSANFFLDRYHIDGLRVDAVASMLYLDYSRARGEWIPNEFGGNENLAAEAFLRQLNATLYGIHPGIQMIAEESTAWPGVTEPADQGGLGFGFKWDLGWMHDTLKYMGRDSIHRSHHGGDITFRAIYMNSENFVLPLSHDEVVHGKGSLLDKMPGDRWRQFANLRLLLGYQFATPGKKLTFMGSELGVSGDWNHERELDWGLLVHSEHRGMRDFVAALNHMYRAYPALHAGDCHPVGFEWLIADDTKNTVFAFLRSAGEHPPVLVVANFTPVPRHGYRIGVPVPGVWRSLVESDAAHFGGSGLVNGDIISEPVPAHGHNQSVTVTASPLAISFFISDDNGGDGK